MQAESAITNIYGDCDLYLLLRYVDNSYLKELIREYNIKHISVDQEARDYIQTLSSTIPVYENGMKKNGIWLFDKFLTIASLTDLSEASAAAVLDKIINTKEECALWDSRSTVALFVQALYRQKLYGSLLIQEKIKSAIEVYIDEFMRNDIGISNMWGPIVSLMNCLYAAGHPFSNVSSIKKIISGEEHQFAIEVSSVCSNEVREYVKNYFSWDNQTELRKDPNLYAYLILNDYVEKDSQVEQYAFECIQKELEIHKAGVYNLPSNTLFLLYMNVFLAEKMINKVEFKKLVSESNEDYIKWMIDPSTFDYANFKPEWLTRLRKVMLEKLAADEEIASKIRTAFAEKYNGGKAVNESESIIMRYFMGYTEKT